MKFTLSWLKDHLDTDADLDRVVETMIMAGLEVEEVVDPGARLAAFSVARIVEANQHPNADRLRVCQVETKDGRKEIVCGAPNARAGLVTIYAPIGAYVPGLDVTLEARPVRGVVSNGMLCSGAELEVDTEADGILELDSKLAVGTPAAEALGRSDPVIDFEVTPNRGDWLGVAGIARDLAAAGLGRLKTKSPPPVRGAFASPVGVETEAPEACPVFAGRMIRGLKNGPSPEWLRRRLEAIGLKPRNALVDVTNYLSFDRARPLHVYDAAKLSGNVRARMGRAGEKLLALDGKTYDISPEMCVIADDRGVLGLGGVMGGEESGCTAETESVLIESAWFDPIRTWKTARATGIKSDAAYRFERSVDPGFVVPGLELATRLILDLCGGEASEIVVAGQAPSARPPIAFDPARVLKLAGMPVSAARTRAILKALGFDAAPEREGGGRLIVAPPSWRRDVDGPADLVEEVARIDGYHKLPSPAPALAQGRRPAAGIGESRARLARRALASAGYFEAVTWSFCARPHAELFGGGAASLVLANPIASDLDCMRPSALPNLLRAAQRNLDRGRGESKLFEAGPIYLGDKPEEQRRAIAAIYQPRPKRFWKGAPQADLFDIKRDLLWTLRAMGAPMAALQAAPAKAAWLHPGRGGALKLGAAEIAVFGEPHPRVLAALGVDGPALVFEIQVDALPAPRAKADRARPALEKQDLLPVTRDFAFVVEEAVAAADLVRAASGADRALIADVNLFDVYRGPGVPDGAKSLALEVILQPREKTLTDQEIEAVAQRIVSAAKNAVGATLRA